VPHIDRNQVVQDGGGGFLVASSGLGFALGIRNNVLSQEFFMNPKSDNHIDILHDLSSLFFRHLDHYHLRKIKNFFKAYT